LRGLVIHAPVAGFPTPTIPLSYIPAMSHRPSYFDDAVTGNGSGILGWGFDTDDAPTQPPPPPPPAQSAQHHYSTNRRTNHGSHYYQIPPPPPPPPQSSSNQAVGQYQTGTAPYNLPPPPTSHQTPPSHLPPPPPPPRASAQSGAAASGAGLSSRATCVHCGK
jgi:hypothetical protein